MKTNSNKRTPIQALGTLHESASLRAVTGTVLRPGGFQLTERGITLCNFSREAHIVDVGCGMGASVAYLRDRFHFKVLGCDISEKLLKGNNRFVSLPLVLASAEQLPVATGTCDGVLCECVLSLIAEPDRVLAEFFRVLRPGGCFIVSDLYDRGAEDKQQDDRGENMTTVRTRQTIESIVVDKGFSVLAWEDHTRYLKELIAQMILTQDSSTGASDLMGLFGSGCAGSAAFSTLRPGYYLMVAQKS